MGKASRRHRQQRGKGDPARTPKRPAGTAGSQQGDSRAQADAALARLVRLNPPGKLSLAGAYALGYAALGLAQQEGEEPDWYPDIDPLEALFLGTVWPEQFRDSSEFANACAAWLDLLRNTVHWSGIGRFVREAVDASEEHDLPVDSGELMLLLAARLEPAGLNQRTLPHDLLPDKTLAQTRLAVGPDKDTPFPAPPGDAAERVARFWDSVQARLVNDGTAVDGLREGLHMFASAGLDVRADPAVLLPALYAGLVAGEFEDLREAGDRAPAWALSLRPGSPLVPVTDVLLLASGRGLDTDTTLGHLFALPAFTEQVSVEDRDWHSSPGTALKRIAFDLGYDQVTTRDGKVMRMSAAAKAAFQAQERLFEEKFGRPPGPQDPLFFDPAADEPRPMAPVHAEQAGVKMLEAAGSSPAWIYAYQHTGGLLPRFDGTFTTDADQAEWQENIDRYMKLHEPGGHVDHAAETRKLQNVLVSVSVKTAADDPQHGTSVIDRLSRPPLPDDGETTLLRQYLHVWKDNLAESVAKDATLMDTACEYARAWAGGQLAAQVRQAAQQHTPDLPDPVLFAIATATIGKEQG